MAFYSIGASCLPKFGIDDFMEKSHTYFFDWLITDIVSLERSLLSFSENHFLREGYEVCDNALRVKDIHTGIKFQHDFPTTEEGKVDTRKIEQTLESVRSKYIRRRNRLFDCVREDVNATLVRYDFSVGKGDKTLEKNMIIESGNAWIHPWEKISKLSLFQKIFQQLVFWRILFFIA